MQRVGAVVLKLTQCKTIKIMWALHQGSSRFACKAILKRPDCLSCFDQSATLAQKWPAQLTVSKTKKDNATVCSEMGAAESTAPLSHHCQRCRVKKTLCTAKHWHKKPRASARPAKQCLSQSSFPWHLNGIYRYTHDTNCSLSKPRWADQLMSKMPKCGMYALNARWYDRCRKRQFGRVPCVCQKVKPCTPIQCHQPNENQSKKSGDANGANRKWWLDDRGQLYRWTQTRFTTMHRTDHEPSKIKIPCKFSRHPTSPTLEMEKSENRIQTKSQVKCFVCCLVCFKNIKHQIKSGNSEVSQTQTWHIFRQRTRRGHLAGYSHAAPRS